jgi:acetyl-CoA carboxylase biotin carboxylase subunit
VKLLVANRGAIARRIVRACSELGIDSVVVYAEPDAHAPYVAEATQAFALPGQRAADTYLNQELLLQIARTAGAHAVHPGYGFLAENAAFAAQVIEQGMLFVGPAPHWLRTMGDKVNARKLMAEHGFPVFAGSEVITNVQSAIDAAERIGFPVLVKPTGGGGGLGMEVVRQADSARLEEVIQRAAQVAQNAFGSAAVYLEKYIERPRHIEFQILADSHGQCVHLFERECSVQRRNQKLIEESPAPGLDPLVISRTADLAAEICGAIGYDSAGTVETLFTQENQVGFLEMNTRIQVEHGVTELVTGIDLVQAQIRLAGGAHLNEVIGIGIGESATSSGYAMEVRLYAEDSKTLLPSTGRLNVFRPPTLTGVRIETGYAEGQTVTPYYDPLLAKILAHGSTREMAIGRLVVALRAFAVQGVTTNADLLTRVLGSELFLAGRLDTDLLRRI